MTFIQTFPIDARLLAPKSVELFTVATKAVDPGRPLPWDFVNDSNVITLPVAADFRVQDDLGNTYTITQIGFRRRVVSAFIAKRNLRLGQSLFFTLNRAVPNGAQLTITNLTGNAWPIAMPVKVKADPARPSCVIHVNQVGYHPSFPKKAKVGYFLGSLGELPIEAIYFSLVNPVDGAIAYTGRLTLCTDSGFNPNSFYHGVYEADFSTYATPGKFAIQIDGIGRSDSFFIDAKCGETAARTYALGMYHQRCGGTNALPYTRFTHGACHTAAALIPSVGSETTWAFIAGEPANPDQTAVKLTSPGTSLYPFVNTGSVDVSGGHHDAGDYSKYTINMAQLINALIFAADNFPGVSALDGLGIPESGDGKSDILKEAKWEADALAKMQDADGGFYFLVYPKERKYESNVLPDAGDPQVVWPKNTAVTAAAVGALAQCAGSPAFKAAYPTEAAAYLVKARAGFTFLTNAIAAHGKTGAYQKLTHYGDIFMHDDELSWAACEMFCATGEAPFHAKLLEWLPDPTVEAVKRWTWWRLFEGYGAAIRSYAFAVKSGRLSAGQMNAAYLTKCTNEVIAGGEDALTRSKSSAYGVSFPLETKHIMNASYVFPLDQAFDLAAAYQLSPKADYFDAILQNLNYEFGCNPNNMAYLTGIGRNRLRDIVNQFSQNDGRALPPSGILVGSIVGGFSFLSPYHTSGGGNELQKMSYPADFSGNPADPLYPIYDRWGDSFNIDTESVTSIIARGLAVSAWLFARGNGSSAWVQPFASLNVAASGSGWLLTLSVSGEDLTKAVIVWDVVGKETCTGGTQFFVDSPASGQVVEVEAMLLDGRRAFAKVTL